MSIIELAPKWKREDKNLPVLNREINRLFDDFLSGFELAPVWSFDEKTLGSFRPRVNLSETDKEIKIAAELPGMDEKNVTVELDDDSTISIHGERKEEHEEKNKRWHRVEHTYGSFHRTISLPAKVDGSQTKAVFKNGILSVTLPKQKEDQDKKKSIKIETE